MADKTGIEWTDATWNPTTGCDRVSDGCDNCYALTLAGRLKAMGSAKYQTDGDPRTSGPGFGIAEHATTLDQPLRWTKPRMIFVNSMSDLFHDGVSDAFIAEVFSVMARAPRHTFQVLTKRHGRMRSLLNRPSFRDNLAHLAPWPLPNVWLGVSVEDQKRADLRVPALLDTPAAVRWLSCEPLLGPVDLGIGDPHRGHDSDDVNGHPHPRICLTCSTDDHEVEYFRRDQSANPGIDWLVVGGESGGAHVRPMDVAWARSLRDQCAAVELPFLFKQWGHHDAAGQPVGKHAAGRTLDSRTHDDYPVVARG